MHPQNQKANQFRGIQNPTVLWAKMIKFQGTETDKQSKNIFNHPTPSRADFFLLFLQFSNAETN